jgi:hypothetical protein
VFEVLPRHILMHLPDTRLLLEGQTPTKNPTASTEIVDTATAAAVTAHTASPPAAAAVEAVPARPGLKLSRQLSLSGQRWWRSQQKRAMKTGEQPQF